MRWFRFYDEVLDDPKVQRLPGDLFKAWVNLMCLANRGKPRGTINSISDIAFGLRISEAEAERLVSELQARGLMEWGDNDTVEPHNWHGRQFQSDNVTPRVNKHRGQLAEPATSNVTSNVTPAVSGNVACNAPETETETETDISGVPPRKPQPKKAERPKPPGFSELRSAFVDRLGTGPTTKGENRKWTDALLELHEAGITPEKVPKLIDAYRQRHGLKIPCNPRAIANNLSNLLDEKTQEGGESEPWNPSPAELAEINRRKIADFEASTIPPPWLQTRTNGKSSVP